MTTVTDKAGIVHTTSRLSGGEGMSYWLQAVCTCGWKSQVEYAYEDYQHIAVHGYEGDHIVSTKWWEK